MKNIKQVFLIIIAVLLFTSCSSKSKESLSVIVKPKTTSIKGDLGKYFDVVDKEYQIKKGKNDFNALITVEVKRNNLDFSFPTDNINPFGTNGDEKYHVGFGIELFDEASPVVIKSATEGGFGGPYSSDDVTGLIKLGKGETGFIRWSVNESEGLKSFQITSAVEKSQNTSSVSNDNVVPSNDCDKFIKDYEAFATSYIKIMKKYKNNPSDASILTEYTEIMQKAAEMQNNATNCTDAKYAAKIMNIANKMATAAM